MVHDSCWLFSLADCERSGPGHLALLHKKRNPAHGSGRMVQVLSTTQSPEEV